MSDKPRTYDLIEGESSLIALPVCHAEIENGPAAVTQVIELEPVLDLLERVVTTTSVDGCRTLQGDIEAILREHGRVK